MSVEWEALFMLRALDPEGHGQVEAMPATWFVSSDGLVHGRPGHDPQSSRVRGFLGDPLAGRRLCPLPGCATVGNLAGERVLEWVEHSLLLDEIVREVSGAEALLNEKRDSTGHAVTKLEHARSRLSRRAGKRTRAVDDLAQRVETLIRGARTLTGLPGLRETHREEAVTTYLRLCDLGPLAELREMLLGCLVSTSGAPGIFTVIIWSCDGSAHWSRTALTAIENRVAHGCFFSEQAPQLLDSPQLQEAVHQGVPLPDALARALVQRAGELLREVPLWWARAREETLAQDVDMLVYLPTGYLPSGVDSSLPSGVDPSWECYRESLNSPLLVAPYPVGRLLQAVYDLPAVPLEKSLSRAEAEVCRTLLLDSGTPIRSRDMERIVETSRLLAR